jgi:hypothetical protein
MRTTVTIDSDVERLIRETMHRCRSSFKTTLNDAVRQALSPKKRRTETSKFKVKSRPLGLLAGVDPARLSDIDTDLEIDEFRKTTDRLNKSKKRK